MNIRNYFLIIQTLFIFQIFSVQANPNLTSKEFEYFKQLPEDQQQALIKPFIKENSSNNSFTENDELVNEEAVKSRTLSSSALLDEMQKDENKNKEKNKLTPKELSRFGLSLFAGSPSSFTPLSSVPVPPDYILGPNDEIVIQIYGKENQEYRLIVQRDGNIHFPILGTMNVVGMNFTQMKQFISTRIEEEIIGVRSNISLGELRSMQIFVLGDAYKPGAYSVSALTTISQAIYLSGGFNENGALRNVQLKRQGKWIRTLDMYDLLLKGDTKDDVRLQPGDTLFIGSIDKTVAVYGEVNRPAIYEIAPKQSLQSIIAMAGGLTSNALMENLRIKRQVKNGLSKILSANMSLSQDLQIPLFKGDEINVLSRGNVLSHYVSIEGDVINSGLVAWKKGLRVSDVFSSIDAAFYETTDLSYGLIVRKIDAQKNIRLIQFNIENAILNPTSQDNIKLNSEDKILIFNRYELAESVENKAVKTLEQAQEQSIEDKKQLENILSDQIEFSSQKLNLISENSDKNKDEVVERIQRTSRKALLSPLLLQLEQQSTFVKPAPIVEIMGAVKNPGRYPLTSGAKIKDLVIAAGGLTEDAFISSAELSRTVTDFNSKQISIKTSQFDLGKAVRDEQTSNLFLMARDKINVLQKPGVNQLEMLVTLKGEVRFPGSYTISAGETLSELIGRAGGLTKQADPEGAIFTREILRLQEEKLLKDYVDDLRKEAFKKSLNAETKAYSDPTNALALIEEATQSKALGRMVVKLKDVIAGKRATDFLLEDGDFLFVPKFKNTISVIGEVQVSVTYLLDDSLTVTDYIKKAGGLKKRADEERIFVIRADGSVFKPEKNYWFKQSSDKLKAGDTIIVPIDTNYRDPLSLWEVATTMLYQTGVAVNALRR